MTAFRMHGWTVHSQIPLHHPPGEPHATPDLVVSLGTPRPVPDGAAAGDLVAALVDPANARLHYSVTRSTRGVILRAFGLAEMTVDAAMRHVTVHPDPDTDEAVLPVLVSGLLISTLLQLRGATVLHASAVAGCDGAVAFVGPSGAGKSTLAALLCSVGALLVTDDVLRVDVEQPVQVFRGSPESRLRATALSLLPSPDAARSRTTGDGRLAVTAPQTGTDRVPLRRLLLPRLDGHSPTRCIPLEPLEAVRALLASPRVSGWRHPESTRRYFESVADLVEAVPVHALVLPRAQPFTRAAAEDLHALVFA